MGPQEREEGGRAQERCCGACWEGSLCPSPWPQASQGSSVNLALLLCKDEFCSQVTVLFGNSNEILDTENALEDRHVGRQQRGGVCETDWARAFAPRTSMEPLPCKGFMKMSLAQDFPSCIVKFPLHN